MTKRRQMPGVAEVEGVAAARHRRAGRRLDRDDPHVALVAQLLAEEREGDAGEVRAAAGAADDDVRVGVGRLHLLDRLLADHRLVQQDVIEHAAQRVFGVVALGGDLDRLGDGDAEAAGRIRILRQDGAAGVGLVARAGDAGRAVGLHQRPAIGLLIVRDPDHVDLDLEAEQRAGEGERRAPLAGAGLGGELLHPRLLVVEGLRDGGVGLVAAGRADALVFVKDAGRRAERLLQVAGAIERRRPPHAIDVAHRPGDLDFALGADFLPDQRHREQRREVVGADRLAGSGMQHRRRGRQIGGDVVPNARDPILAQLDT